MAFHNSFILNLNLVLFWHQDSVNSNSLPAWLFWVGWLIVGLLLGYVIAKFRLMHKHSSSEPELLEKPLATQKEAMNLPQLNHLERLANLGVLVAGVAHEVRNPLNFMSNFADLSGELVKEIRECLDAEPLSPERQEELNHLLTHLEENCMRIMQHGDRANRILTRVLTQARHSNKDFQLVNLNRLLDEYATLCFHAIRAKHPARKHHLVKQLSDTLPEVELDSQEFSRVILNVLDNGFYAADQKAAGQDKGAVAQVTVATLAQDDWVEIRIEDNGQGISPDQKDKIFDLFFTTKPVDEGTGLGLCLSKEIVMAHHGNLDIESEQGKGTLVTIRVPLFQPKTDPE